MKNSTSLFSQLLQLVPRRDFEGLVNDHQADRYSKGFSCWSQLVAMLFAQLAHANSIREVIQGLNSCEGKLNHLGILRALSRSTLSYANRHRPWEVYMGLFYHLLNRFKSIRPGKAQQFRFKNKLLSIDSTTISLCLSVFDWARYRQTKGAIKLHLLLDHDGYLPRFAHVTEGAIHDRAVLDLFPMDPGSIFVMDRGYVDYTLFYEWTKQGVFFVMRMKENACFEVVTERPLPSRHPENLLKDQEVEFENYDAKRKCPVKLRLVTIEDAHGRQIEILTNVFHLAASTISAIYKERWQIELLFKALKGNLKVKTFLGTNANAVQIQIWTALIVLLLFKYLQYISRSGWALSNLVALLRLNLFRHVDIHEWLDRPDRGPPPPEQQLLLFGQQRSVEWSY